MKGSIHKPPSRIRYEESHPVVSIRVDRGLYDQLESLCRVTGKSYGDVLREALDKQAPSAKKAYQSGYDAAKLKYAVPFKCVVCGGSIVVQSQKVKEDVTQYLEKKGWGHVQCAQNRAPDQKPSVIDTYTILEPSGASRTMNITRQSDGSIKSIPV